MAKNKRDDVRRARKPKPGSAKSAAPDPWQAIAEHFRLTAVELHVVQLMLDGLSDKEIAARLGRSRSDATKHLQNIRAKFKVHSRMAIVAAIRDFLRKTTGNDTLTPPLN